MYGLGVVVPSRNIQDLRDRPRFPSGSSNRERPDIMARRLRSVRRKSTTNMAPDEGTGFGNAVCGARLHRVSQLVCGCIARFGRWDLPSITRSVGLVWIQR